MFLLLAKEFPVKPTDAPTDPLFSTNTENQMDKWPKDTNNPAKDEFSLHKLFCGLRSYFHAVS